VRCRFFAGMTRSDSVARLPSASQAVEPAGRQPVRQYRAGPSAVPANSTAYPNALAPIVVTLTQTQSMADNSVVTTDGASPRKEFQRDHPGSMLSFVSGNAIKIIRAGVKARR
jgi:hypothetical protein